MTSQTRIHVQTHLFNIRQSHALMMICDAKPDELTTILTMLYPNKSSTKINQYDLLFDLGEDDFLDFAKSKRSLKRASSGFSCFSCFVGVEDDVGLSVRFWVSPAKLSLEEPDPPLELE